MQYNFYDFLRSLIPSCQQVEYGAAVSAIGTIFSYLLGWDSITEALVVLMALDYATGIMAAYINPQLALNSQRGFRGICKKLFILLVVATAHFIDRAIGETVIQLVVTWFYISNEGLSVLENAAKAGIPIPDKLHQKLEQLGNEKR